MLGVLELESKSFYSFNQLLISLFLIVNSFFLNFNQEIELSFGLYKNDLMDEWVKASVHAVKIMLNWRLVPFEL